VRSVWGRAWISKNNLGECHVSKFFIYLLSFTYILQFFCYESEVVVTAWMKIIPTTYCLHAGYSILWRLIVIIALNSTYGAIFKWHISIVLRSINVSKAVQWRTKQFITKVPISIYFYLILFPLIMRIFTNFMHQCKGEVSFSKIIYNLHSFFFHGF